MRTMLWVTIVITTSIFSALLGYYASSKTGIEPGFFDTAEAGGYGAVGSEGDTEAVGIDDEMKDYYKNLLAE